MHHVRKNSDSVLTIWQWYDNLWRRITNI